MPTPRDTAKPCEVIERIMSLTGVERVLADSGEQPPPSLVEKAATAISSAGQVAKMGSRRLRHMSTLNDGRRHTSPRAACPRRHSLDPRPRLRDADRSASCRIAWLLFRHLSICSSIGPRVCTLSLGVPSSPKLWRNGTPALPPEAGVLYQSVSVEYDPRVATQRIGYRPSLFYWQ